METLVAGFPDNSPETKPELEVDSTRTENAQDVLTGFRFSLLFLAALLVAFLMALSGWILAQVRFVARQQLLSRMSTLIPVLSLGNSNYFNHFH